MPSVLSTVANIDDAFKWPGVYVDSPALKHRHTHMRTHMCGMSMATAFSGICTSSCAREALVHTLTNHSAPLPAPPELVGCTERAGTCTWSYPAAIEKDPQCRIELLCLPHPPLHLFGDIEEFLSATAADALSRLDACATPPCWSDLKSILLRHNAVNLSAAYCYICDAAHAFPFATMLVAGHPCVDFSSLGSDLGLS